MRVLLIEDDKVMAQSIELMLRAEAFKVDVTDLGQEGIDFGHMYNYDLIVLDLELPDISGFEVLQSLRQAKIKTPVLVLSGNALIDAKVKALGLGADDYMTKPFYKAELIARIQAVARRSADHSQPQIRIGRLTVNLDTKTAAIDGTNVHLTTKEYQMLELLAVRKDATLTKEMFLNHLYGGLDEPVIKIIEVFICKLRKKLQMASGGAHFIQTIWGRGYSLGDPQENEGALTSPSELWASDRVIEPSRQATDPDVGRSPVL